MRFAVKSKKPIHMQASKFLYLLFMVASCSGVDATTGGGPESEPMADEQKAPNQIDIELVNLPDFRFAHKKMKGSYQQHQQVSGGLMADLAALSPEEVDIIGVYHNDPDVTAEAELEWELGFEVKPEHGYLEGYEHKTLLGGLFVSLHTHLLDAQKDGLRMYQWIIENNYAQRGPTRMIYHNDPKGELTNTPVTILTPVKERNAQLINSNK